MGRRRPEAIPDVAFLWPTPTYAAEGVLENLDPYIQKSGYNLNDYWPGLLESAKYEGSVYGFPRDIEVNVLYYNKELFDKAGRRVPRLRTGPGMTCWPRRRS